MRLLISRAVVGIAASTLGLTGCSAPEYPPYSSSVKYGLRQDPILRSGAAKELGDDRYEPDRPGLLPIMKFDDINKPDHPYHAKAKTIDDKVLRDPTKIPEQFRKDLEEQLVARFGTPAQPTVNVKGIGKDAVEQEGVDAAIEELKLDDKTLEKGSRHFRVHCVHCHGVPGDGRGPTARWINPHPRDFRAGMFKFQSIDRTASSARPPARADLLRTLRNGIEGTAMPTFVLLSDEELESLISYVIHLSLRGSAEMTTIVQAFGYEKGALTWKEDEGSMEDNVKVYTALFLKDWAKSNQPASAIKVRPYPYDENDPDYLGKTLPESVKRGQQIFTAEISNEFKKEFHDRLFPKAFADAKKAAQAQGNKEAEAKIAKEVETAVDAKVLSTLTAAKCMSCHTDYGRQARFKFDEWGTLVRPNNLPQGALRGGKRPVDIYYRIHSGIPGSEMTPFGKTFEGNEQYLWDLVNFVSVLPYERMRETLKLRID
jgi:mono/diheme cytochrome c family protein